MELARIVFEYVDERGSCRECQRDAWTKDAQGYVHVCCAREGPECRACSAGVGQVRKQAERVAAREENRNNSRRGKRG